METRGLACGATEWPGKPSPAGLMMRSDANGDRQKSEQHCRVQKGYRAANDTESGLRDSEYINCYLLNSIFSSPRGGLKVIFV
jgi:hypothetical protein